MEPSQYFTEAEIDAMMADLAQPDIALECPEIDDDDDLPELPVLAASKPLAPLVRFVPHGSRRLDGPEGRVVFLAEVVWTKRHGLLVSTFVYNLTGGLGGRGNSLTTHYFAKAYYGDDTLEAWHRRFDTNKERAFACDEFLKGA